MHSVNMDDQKDATPVANRLESSRIVKVLSRFFNFFLTFRLTNIQSCYYKNVFCVVCQFRQYKVT